jgi:hypothetical protein
LLYDLCLRLVTFPVGASFENEQFGFTLFKLPSTNHISIMFYQHVK